MKWNLIYQNYEELNKKYFDNRFLDENSISELFFPDTRKITNAHGVKFVKISKTEEIDTKLMKYWHLMVL